MRPGRMRNGAQSRSADGLGVWTDADCGGVRSPGVGSARGDGVATVVALQHAPCGVPRNLRAPGIGPRAPRSTRLETRTKESDMRASQRVRKPVRRREADWWDPSPLWVHRRPTLIF